MFDTVPKQASRGPAPAVLMALTVLLVSMSAPAIAQDRPHVLVLNSYHPGYEWSDGIMEGIVQRFEDDNVVLSIEYMDTKRHFDGLDGRFVDVLRQSYATRYQDERFDVIIACDDNAFQFVLRFGQSLFGEVPVVFCGVNVFDPNMIADHPNMTGVVEQAEHRPTINLILDLHPDVKRIAFITDSTTSGMGNRHLLGQIEAEYEGRVGFMYLDHQTTPTREQMLHALGQLPPDTVVFYRDFFRDATGRYFTPHEIMPRVADAAPSPVYVSADFYIGHGAFGGWAVSGRQQGIAAAELAQRILAGQPASSIEIQGKSPNIYMFDGRVARRFGLSRQELPDEAVVLHIQPSFYRRHATIIWLTSGVFAGLVGVILLLTVNIVRRQRAEAALRRSERNYREVFNASSDAIAIHDPQTGEVLDVNERLRDMYHLGDDPDISSLGEVSNGSPPYSHEDAAAWIRKAATEGPQLFEWRARRLDGTLFWAEVHLRAATIGGQPRVLAMIRDISDRKAMEQQRREFEERVQHAQKLESLGVLAGGIAHDFNNLLVAIMGNADLALEEMPSDSAFRESVQEIKRASMRASELTNQMLAYTGRAASVLERLDVSDVVREMGRLLRVSISKRVTLDERLATGLPAVEADAAQIRQVVMNLITNASDAIGDADGQISLSTLRVESLSQLSPQEIVASNGTAAGAGSWVCIQVSDTGCGMDEETRRRLFEPFFTTKFTGRGLGTAAVLGIVKAHRGAIALHSRPGEGTTITVLLPVCDSPTPLPSSDKPPPRRSTVPPGTTILVIDDEPDVRRMAQAMLARAEVQAYLAEDGLEGLDLFRRRADEIDLVLLDMTMPRMSGPEVCRELRALRPTVPVILTSGYSQRDVYQAVKEREGVYYLAKPFQYQALIEVVHEALSPSAK